VIDFQDNQINLATGTLRLRGVFENPAGTLVPGGFARVRLAAGRSESALLIPEAAIGSEQTRKFVFVVNAEQSVEVRPVELGRPQGTQLVVLAGLQPQDRVVISGVMMLRPGIKVQLQGAAAPGAVPAGQGK
jgi:multidrug efflux system membrane fusion protein